MVLVWFGEAGSISLDCWSKTEGAALTIDARQEHGIISSGTNEVDEVLTRLNLHQQSGVSNSKVEEHEPGRGINMCDWNCSSQIPEMLPIFRHIENCPLREKGTRGCRCARKPSHVNISVKGELRPIVH